MELKKYLTILSVLVVLPTLSGCSSLSWFKQEKEIVVQTEYVEKKIPLTAAAKPMTLNDVTWYVVTEANFEEFVEKYKKENGNEWVFYAISVRGYEAMALNMAEIRRFVEEQKAVIVYYEGAISGNKKEDNAEASSSPNKAEQ